MRIPLLLFFLQVFGQSLGQSHYAFVNFAEIIDSKYEDVHSILYNEDVTHLPESDSQTFEIEGVFAFEKPGSRSMIHFGGCHCVNDNRTRHSLFVSKFTKLEKPSDFYVDTFYTHSFFRRIPKNREDAIAFENQLNKIYNSIDSAQYVVSFKSPYWFRSRMNKALRKCNSKVRFDGVVEFAVFKIKMIVQAVPVVNSYSFPNFVNRRLALYPENSIVEYEIVDILSFEPYSN